MTERPSRLSVGLAALAGTVAVVALASVPVAAGVAGIGLLVLLVGLDRAVGRAVGAGTVLLLGGVLLGGVFGVAPEALLLATATAVLAWDVGDNGLGMAAQLGREAATARAELVHAAATTSVLAVGTGLCYTVFRLVTGTRPVAALVLLLFGALALAAALR
ncbi:DUF7519 family protein [Natronomonas sp. EA1]|uniref:DUF7519 family protein n=1 Tax=Natronomonas sp. EA1 TaxID=3421655 RepID=UPI003EBEF05E